MQPTTPTPEPEQQETLRYVLWLVVGVAALGWGLSGLYQLYSAPSSGFVGLLVALLCGWFGAYVVLAVLFNLWLPQPRLTRFQHHRKVSIAIMGILAVGATVVGLRFPRLSPKKEIAGESVAPKAQLTASPNASRSPYVTHPSTPKRALPHSPRPRLTKESVRPIAAVNSPSPNTPSPIVRPTVAPAPPVLATPNRETEPLPTATPQPTLAPSANIPHLTHAEKYTQTATVPNYPVEIQVTIATDREIKPFQIAVYFDGDVAPDARTPGVLSGLVVGAMIQDSFITIAHTLGHTSNVVLYKATTVALSPESPAIITAHAKTALRVVQVQQLPVNYTPPREGE